MATIIGRNAKVAISSDGSNWTDIGKVKSAKLTIKDDTADETNNDSAGYKEQQYSDSQATLDFGFKYNSADAGQAALIAAKAAKAIRWFRLRPTTASGEKEFKLQGTIGDLTVDTQTSQVEDGSCSVASTGTITTATQ